MLRVRHRSDAVNVDYGQFVGRGLKDLALVVSLHELAPVSGLHTRRGKPHAACQRPGLPRPGRLSAAGDSVQTPRGSDAGVFAAAAQGPPSDRGTQTAPAAVWLTTLREPHHAILSRVRCITWFDDVPPAFTKA